MEQMEFNILRRAQDYTKGTRSLDLFFYDRGIDINQVRKNPDYYGELIMQYSRLCISQQLFRESKERMEEEFKKICDFHRKNESYLVEQFYDMAKLIIKGEIEDEYR